MQCAGVCIPCMQYTIAEDELVCTLRSAACSIISMYILQCCIWCIHCAFVRATSAIDSCKVTLDVSSM